MNFFVFLFFGDVIMSISSCSAHRPPVHRYINDQLKCQCFQVSGTFLELWLCYSLMNPQSHLGDLVFEMLLCADSSEDTIPEELSKHLLAMCLHGDLHLFISNLVVSAVLRRKHKLESLKSLISMDTFISSNTLM